MVRIPALWKACLLSFIGSFCFMVIELVASRILAPYVGVSLYTWTSIIGVALTGMSLGYYAGGKLADRYASATTLLAIFWAAGLATLSIIPLTGVVTGLSLPRGTNIMGVISLYTFLLFFFPTGVMAMTSPVVIKLTLKDLRQTGGVVGTIYAFSTVGSIVGTFATGFFFIEQFGTRSVVWLVGVVLFLTGIVAWFSYPGARRRGLDLMNLALGLLALSIALVFVSFLQSMERWQLPYVVKESNYYTLRVYDDQIGTTPVRALALDRLIHSYVSLDDPTFLGQQYEPVFAQIAHYYITTQNLAPRVLFLGGGGYTVPRFMEKLYPSATLEVVEIDPAVTQVSYDLLGLSANTRIKTYNQDARLFFIQRPTPGEYDLILGDVFNDIGTPFHLTTLEFNRLVRDNLKPQGIYMVNILDRFAEGRFLPSFVQTLRQAFPYVYIFATQPSWEDPDYTLFVVTGSRLPMDLTRFPGTLRGPVLDPAEVEKWLAQRKPVLLTDDYVPVDGMVASLFYKYIK